MSQSQSPYGSTTSGAGRRPLPRYSSLSVATLPQYPTAGDLDVSTIGDPDNTKQAFEFCLERKTSSQREAWATLRLLSTVPSSLQRPRYTAGDNLEGSVILDLRKPQAIASISVTLRGRMITGSAPDASHLFIEVAHPVWDSSSGTPLPVAQPETPSGDQATSAPASGSSKSSNSKIQPGYYEWPFSFPFPTEFQDSIQLTVKQNRRLSQMPGGHRSNILKHATPQTIAQRNLQFNITYDLTLKITTGGIFTSRHRMIAPVLYIPIDRPPSLPPLRASAYLAGTHLVNPEEDPSGWQAFPPMHLSVHFDANPPPIPTNVSCTLYIATPTIYTRGTAIPCHLICQVVPDLRSPEANGSHQENGTSIDDATTLLHAFTSQQCIALTLLQHVYHTQDPQQALASRMSDSVRIGSGFSTDDRSIHTEDVGAAVWWAPTNIAAGEGGGGKVYLEGEIHIDQESLPTCSVPFLKVSHSLTPTLNQSSDLIIQPTLAPVPTTTSASPSTRPPPPPPSAASKKHKRGQSSMSSKNPGKIPLPSLAIQIVTAHAQSGPKPIPFTPRPPRKKKDRSTTQELQYLMQPMF